MKNPNGHRQRECYPKHQMVCERSFDSTRTAIGPHIGAFHVAMEVKRILCETKGPGSKGGQTRIPKQCLGVSKSLSAIS